MADGKYSLDDILNEYSGSTTGGGSSDIDIDAILGGYDKPSAPVIHKEAEKAHVVQAVPVAAAAETVKPVEPAKPAEPVAAVASEAHSDSFEAKYARFESAVTAVKERENAVPVPPTEKPARSFSQKMEQNGNQEVIRQETEEEEKKSPLVTIRGKRNEEPVIAYKLDEPPIQSISGETKTVQADPFEKYASIEEAIEQREKQDIEEILNEYAAEKKPVRNENTQHKSFTDFFTKLIPKAEESEEGKITGNTELLDGMLKAKRERVSRTQHISPIERKSISDIDLNLDDKIIHDTAQLPVDNENSEQAKIDALKERRSKKIKDFVLVGDEEDIDEDDAENEGQEVVIDDFENFNDAPSIAHDIAQLKGGLMLRLFVLAICFAVSFYIAVANDNQGMPIMELLNKRTQTNTFLFVNAIIGLLAAFSSYTVISCGLSKLLSFKADCDSLCAVSIVSSIATSMIMLANGNLIKGSFVHIYVPVAIASLLFNTIGKLCIVKRTQRSFKFVSGSSDKYAVFHVDNDETAQSFTRGALNDFPNLASMRKTEFISEFLKTSYASDSTDRFCQMFTPAVLAAAVVLGIIAGILGHSSHGSSSVYIGISVFTAVTSICTGFSMMLVVNLPMLRASKKNAEVQGVVLGYESIDEFAETNSILIDAGQLFPQGSVKLAAIKVFSDTRIDEAIVEAASLASQAGSILQNMFYDIIAGKTELLNPVESYIYEDSMGLCGWINNKRVLLGNRELMVNHSIEGMPPLSKEKEYTENGRCAVYLSISGELSAMFLVEINPTMEVRQSLQELQKNGIYVMIRSVDSLVTINRLSELFEISPEYLKLIQFRVHEQFAEVTAYQMNQKATLACSGRFAALASLILSCRYMKATIGVGITLQAVSMLLGVLISLVMVVTGCVQELSVSMLMMYNFIFTAILVIFQLVRKN